MANELSPNELMAHVRALADDIGPRPAGTPREAQAQAYVNRVLRQAGFEAIETIPFRAPRTWGYALILPVALALVGNFLLGRMGRLMGGLLSLYGLRSAHDAMVGRRTALAGLAPVGPSATQVVRVPCVQSPANPRQTLVFIGHVDANRHRLTFSPLLKHLLTTASLVGSVALVTNAALQLARAVLPRKALRRAHRLSVLDVASVLGLLLADEIGSWVDGANDNATAVACTLGLAAYLHENPLPHTEVWFAFTGAEEVGLLGTHALLDAHGDRLKDAYFVDFEMVGAGRLAYISRHSSFAWDGAYQPDADSVALAQAVSHAHPDWKVQSRDMVILEEVAALRDRGYRGICLVGVGDDGYLVNWHQHSDTSAQIDPACLERAAQFGLAYAHRLDETTTDRN
jgi:hypothetical protein